MGVCDTCGNEYDKKFVSSRDQRCGRKAVASAPSQTVGSDL